MDRTAVDHQQQQKHHHHHNYHQLMEFPSDTDEGVEEALAEGESELIHESNRTRIYRLSDPNNRLGGWGGGTPRQRQQKSDVLGNGNNGNGFVAVKMLADPNPRPEQIARLHSEYILSRSPLLSRCGATRAALHQTIDECTADDGGGRCRHRRAIYLEWVPGVNLREWVKSLHRHHHGHGHGRYTEDERRYTLYSVVHLAWKVSLALCAVHEAGVVHNNLTADNIIVETSFGGGEARGPRGACNGVCGGVGGCGTASTEVLDAERMRYLREGEHGHGDGGVVRFSVKIIDLGSAALLKEQSMAGGGGGGEYPDDIGGAAETSARRDDLASLGEVLYLMFSGRSPSPPPLSGDEVGESSSDGHVPPPPTRPLHELDDGHLLPCGRVPRSVSTLVSNLMGLRRRTESGRPETETAMASVEEHCRYVYQSAKEVELDLHQMMDYPEHFLIDIDPRSFMGVPEFPSDRLYGRQAETSILLDAYNRVVASSARNVGCAGGGIGPTEVILVTGLSGTGKSSLVQQTRESFVATGGYFLSGKFDSMRRNAPLSVIIAAFTEHCENILRGGADDLAKTRDAILERVGPDGVSVLIDLIPSLGPLMGAAGGAGTDDASVPAEASRVGGMEAQNRFRHVFPMFVAAFSGCRSGRPLVLFLDDLQWADAASLGLIRMLVTDHQIRNFLFVGCYRDNEVNDSHPLASLLIREIEARDDVSVATIRVGNIGRGAMNHLLADTLRSSRSAAGPLTDCVYDRTGGNTFFAIQYLKSLCDEGLLEFSASSASWRWDVNAVRSRPGVGRTALELMAGKIGRLPVEVQNALGVAACLGHHSDEKILRLVLEEDMVCSVNGGASHQSVDCLGQILDIAVNQELLARRGSRYSFVHDQIQLAAYSTIREAYRGAVHLRIGKTIWKKSTPAMLEEVLFTVVDQISHGLMFVEECDTGELAKLFARAGRKAMSSSLFLSAATYLKMGIRMLGVGHWDDHYDLSLQLYESCAEAEYCNGNFDEMGQVLDEIFSHARDFAEKLGAYHTLVNGLGARDKVQEAIHAGFSVLERLGEPFPNADMLEHLLWPEWTKTRDMLDEYTDETLVMIELMADEEKSAAMEFLDSLLHYTYMEQQEYFPFVIFRMMQLSLKYGICKESAIAFADYGLISSAYFGDIKRGYQFGQFALVLLERFRSKDCLAHVYFLTYGCINHWSEDVRRGLESLLYGYTVGLKFGEIEHAMLNAWAYCLNSLQCGKTLDVLFEETGVFCEQMIKYQQASVLALTAITMQTIQNLMGCSDNPLQLTGEAMNEDDMIEKARTKNNVPLIYHINVHRMWLAYLFYEYELAAELADGSRNDDWNSGYMLSNQSFYDALACLAMARTQKAKKWTVRANRAMKKMKNWALHAPCNFRHKVALLEAEFSYQGGHTEEAEMAFDTAISLSDESGFVHEQALAYERAAIFHSSTGDRSKASQFYDLAHDFYLEWGARGKADHIRCQSVSLLIDGTC